LFVTAGAAAQAPPPDGKQAAYAGAQAQEGDAKSILKATSD
jgi:hypothetical protein